jgi:ATP-dependent DNA helicase DinG
VRQGFGRLIRRGTDRGVVAILDGRLHTKGYGAYVLRTLPPTPPIQTIEAVARFLAEGGTR